MGSSRERSALRGASSTAQLTSDPASSSTLGCLGLSAKTAGNDGDVSTFAATLSMIRPERIMTTRARVSAPAAAGGATHASHGRPWMDAPGFRGAWTAQRNGPRTGRAI